LVEVWVQALFHAQIVEPESSLLFAHFWRDYSPESLISPKIGVIDQAGLNLGFSKKIVAQKIHVLKPIPIL